MSNIVVNSATSFLNSGAVVRINSKQETCTENFDETLKGLQNDSGTTQLDKAEVNRPDKNNVDDAKTKKLVSSGKRDVVKQEEELTEEQMAAISDEVVSQIKEVIQEQFGVSEEELSTIMDSIGISDEELLDASSLTKLVMKLDGIENQADILTNPDFAKDLKEVLSGVDAIKTEVFADAISTEKQPEISNNMEVPEIQPDAKGAEDVLQTEKEADVSDADMQSTEPEVQDLTMNYGTTQMETDTNETDEGQTDGMFKQNDSKEEMPIDDGIADNQIVQAQDFAAKLTEDLTEKVGEKQATEIVKQVIEQVQVQTKQGITSMEMQLYPEHLGKVLVQVVSKDGQITAQITAETEAAKNALESQLTILKENLNNQGVKIENVEVTIASHAFEQNMQGEREQEQRTGNGSRGKRAEKILNEGIIEEFSEEPEIMKVRGNTVSYSA